MNNVANLHAIGRDTVIANFSSKGIVQYKWYRSVRLKFSEDGTQLFALIPAGVFQFPVKPRAVSAEDEKARPKIRVVDPRP